MTVTCYNTPMSKHLAKEPRDWKVTIFSLLLTLPLFFIIYLLFDGMHDFWGFSIAVVLGAIIASLVWLAWHGKRSKLYIFYEMCGNIFPW